MEDTSMDDRDIVENTSTPPFFFINSKVNMVDFVHSLKVVTRKKVHSQSFQVHKMKWKQKIKKIVKKKEKKKKTQKLTNPLTF
jgi:hypothetical protein